MLLTSTKLVIQKRQIFMKSALLLLFSILLAWLSYQLIYSDKEDDLKSIQDQKLFIATNLFSRELGGLGDLLTLLANSQALASQKTKKTDIQTKSLSLKAQQQVQNNFIQFGKSSSRIAQIRWIDISGQEIVRVDFTAGQAKVAQAKNLQNKKSRYYFKQGLKVAAPKMYFSSIDLNVEHGEVVHPFESTIRGTIKTSSNTHLLKGLIVVNYRLNNLLTTIRDHSTEEAEISIVNKDGYWLLNPNPVKEWGFMLNQPTLNLKNESPKLWQYKNRHPAGGEYIIDNKLNSFITLTTFDDIESGANANQLMLYTTSNQQLLSHARNKSLLFAFVIFFSLTVCGLFIIWREHRYQNKLIELSLKLKNDQQELKRVNNSLIENIGRQQLLQDELVEANKLSALGLMVAGVAHELNTPIGGAIICLSNADNANNKLKKSMEEGLSKSQFRSGVDLINTSLHLATINLDKAVNHIKHFKRLAIDRVNEDYVECLLDDIVSDLVVSLKPLFKKSNILLIEDIESNLTMVSRPGIISQVLENLVVNSLKHGFESGQTGTIEIKAHKLDNNKICITVSDNGSGIPIAMQNNLFSPFITSGRGKGNIGLGLYMVNQWVTKLLAGKLSFISEQDISGKFFTQFTFLLPIDSNNSEMNEITLEVIDS
jgi:signal transduction histidine kinase